MKAEAVALVPAAGVGSRMGAEVHKAFVTLKHKPMLWHSINQLNQVPEISKIVVALHADDFDYWNTQEDLVDGRKVWKEVVAVEGGETRSHSVREAFNKAIELQGDFFYACVHDAARPFASVDLISSVIQAAEGSGASGCALEVVDTIKQQDVEGFLKTLERKALKALQTPQVIRSDLFKKAYEIWEKQGFPNNTDDLQLIEGLNVKVALLRGDPKNIKITYRNDI